MPWWIVDINSRGKPLIFGPYILEDKADKYKDKNCNKIAEVFELSTRDSIRAKDDLKGDITRMIKRWSELQSSSPGS